MSGIEDAQLPILRVQSIKADSPISLESIAPNPSFVNPVSPDSDQYKFNLSAISSKSASAFTYRVHMDQENFISQCPILLKTAWKPQGDKLGMTLLFSFSSSSLAGMSTLY